MKADHFLEFELQIHLAIPIAMGPCGRIGARIIGVVRAAKPGA